MLDLDWGLVYDSLPLMMRGALITLEITSAAIAFGLALGTVLAVMNISPIAPLRWFATLYVNVFRAIPLVMILLWFYLIVPNFVANVLGLAPQTDIRLIAAITAFVLFEAAYFSEIIRAGLNSIPRSQSKAAQALGMTRMQAMRLILLPQAFRNMTPIILTQSIVIFQDSTLVYILGLGDFFRTATNIGKTTGYYPAMVLLAGAVYFVFCLIASKVVVYLKNKISVKRARA